VRLLSTVSPPAAPARPAGSAEAGGAAGPGRRRAPVGGGGWAHDIGGGGVAAGPSQQRRRQGWRPAWEGSDAPFGGGPLAAASGRQPVRAGSGGLAGGGGHPAAGPSDTRRRLARIICSLSAYPVRHAIVGDMNSRFTRDPIEWLLIASGAVALALVIYWKFG